MNNTPANRIPRDFLGPVNTNVTQQPDLHFNRQGSKEKEIQLTDMKGLEGKIQGLCQAIQALKGENQSMNAIIRNKNQQIFNLKNQLKNQGQNISNNQTKSTRQIYYLNNFRSPNNQSNTINSTELDKAIFQIKLITKQRDDLKKYCEQLEQGSGNVNKIIVNHQPHKNNIQADIINQQHAKVIEQYQQHIASMASKLSTVHKLENQVAQLSQQRNLILQDFQGLRGQLMNRVGYCQHLENQLRRLEQNQKATGGPNNVDFQNIINKNIFLENQIVKLNKILKQKDDKITEIQIGKSGYIQVTKQAFTSMQANIANLQEKINQANDIKKKQSEKTASLQIQINKLNKDLAEKSLKVETEYERAKKNQKQKYQLNQSLNIAKNDLKNIQRKLQDKTFELEKLKAQNQKNKKLAMLAQQGVPQLQNYKKKLKQSEELKKKLSDQINKLQINYGNMVTQNKKAHDLVKQSKAKWETYQRMLKKQSDQIFKLNDVCSRRLQQIDINISKNLSLQAKLRDLARQQDDLTDQIQQYIKENHYVKETQIS